MDLSGLRNLGPVSAGRLREVGIGTLAELETAGPVEAYCRVKERFPAETTLLLLYALQGALWDAHWNELPPETRIALRDAVRARLG